MAVTAPRVTTERVELWEPVAGDRAAMHAIVSHPATRRFLGPGEGPAGHFQRFARNAGSWWLYGYGAFTLRLRGSEEVIGNGGVFHSWRGLAEDFDDKPEAGWILRHDLVGKGIAYEAMTAALSWFERVHVAQTITCLIEPGNAPSLALAGRLDFARVGEAVMPDGGTVVLLTRPAATAPAA